MRTTLNLDDDVLRNAKQYADSRSLTMGKAVSELVRKGLRAPVAIRWENGIPVFDVPADGEVITVEHVKKLESELE